jgi:hypothetical protein
MATNTYVALDKKTVTSSVSAVTFTTIPQGYTDLVVVFNGTLASINGNIQMQFNSDTGTNYSITNLFGNGSVAVSQRAANLNYIYLSYGLGIASATNSTILININNYSNSTTYKTTISKMVNGSNDGAGGVEQIVGLWRNTSAISSITLTGSSNINVGSTFSLYGVAANTGDVTPKATGGVVTSDSTYYYHTFANSGTFTPSVNLSADILVVAGGGSGANGAGGGGGAGGLLGFTGQSLTSGTGYTCTVGAGSSVNSNGNNSQFASLTASVGGGSGAYGNTTGYNGGSGGGGAGNGSGNAGGTGTSGQGNNGGSASSNSYPGDAGGGGGGATAAGGNGTYALGGNGGAGSNAYSSWATVTGTGVSGYYAGGGGGYGRSTSGNGGNGGGGNSNTSTGGTAGMPATGGGGGADGLSASHCTGGSGVIIVRYAK